jgi:hypothetical protein
MLMQPFSILILDCLALAQLLVTRGMSLHLNLAWYWPLLVLRFIIYNLMTLFVEVDSTRTLFPHAIWLVSMVTASVSSNELSLVIDVIYTSGSSYKGFSVAMIVVFWALTRIPTLTIMYNIMDEGSKPIPTCEIMVVGFTYVSALLIDMSGIILLSALYRKPFLHSYKWNLITLFGRMLICCGSLCLEPRVSLSGPRQFIISTYILSALITEITLGILISSNTGGVSFWYHVPVVIFLVLYRLMQFSSLDGKLFERGDSPAPPGTTSGHQDRFDAECRRKQEEKEWKSGAQARKDRIDHERRQGVAG